MNPKLESIAKRAASDLLSFIVDGEQSILDAWNACEQEALDNEGKPKFKLSFAINLDLDEDKMETALTWGVKHKLSKDTSIPDPNQGTFDGTLVSELSVAQFNADQLKRFTGQKSEPANVTASVEHSGGGAITQAQAEAAINRVRG
jgi:hypothetical protein